MHWAKQVVNRLHRIKGVERHFDKRGVPIAHCPIPKTRKLKGLKFLAVFRLGGDETSVGIDIVGQIVVLAGWVGCVAHQIDRVEVSGVLQKLNALIGELRAFHNLRRDRAVAVDSHEGTTARLTIVSHHSAHTDWAIEFFEQISGEPDGESSATIRARVVAARAIQTERYRGRPGIHCNAQMTERMIHQYAEPDAAGIKRLRDAMERFSLSARAYSRILKVARTIADLEASPTVRQHHIMEAIGYRNLDRGDWAG